ncbi:hypothetical protein CHUAL_007163 [Chamberlinius hualienensis]
MGKTRIKLSFFLLSMLLSMLVAEPQDNIIDQDVDAEEFTDGRRGGDQWWRNYESIEEQANSFDDHLEMIYTYRVNPLDLPKPSSPAPLKTNRPGSTTQPTFQTSPTSIKPLGIQKNKQRPQLQKFTKPVEISETTETATPITQLPVIQNSPLRSQRIQQIIQPVPESSTTLAAVPQAPKRRRRPSTPAPLSSTTELPQRRLPQVSQFVPTQTPQLQLFTSPQTPQFQQFTAPQTPQLQQFTSPQTPRFQQFTSSQTPQLQQFTSPQTPQLQQFTSPQTPRFQQFTSPQTPRFQQFTSPQTPQLQQFTSPRTPQVQQFTSPQQHQTVSPQQQPFIPPKPAQFVPRRTNQFAQQQGVQTFASTPQNIVATQTAPPQRYSPQQPSEAQQTSSTAEIAPIVTTLSPNPVNNFPTQNEPTHPSTALTDATTAVPPTPSLPLRFIPGARSPLSTPRLPFNLKAIPNAIPLPAYLFQPKQKSKVIPTASPTQTITSRDVTAAPNVNLFSPTDKNPQQLTVPTNNQLNLRVRNPTARSTDRPNLVDKKLFDVVVPRKSNGERVLANVKSESLTQFSAQSTLNEPQRISLDQSSQTDHPFLQPSESLPRYVRLLNRYSLLHTNNTADNRKQKSIGSNLLSNQTSVDNHPSSARVYNDDVVKKPISKQTRRRRPTTTTEVPQNLITDTITSDSEEIPSFNRINNRNSRSRGNSVTTTTSKTTAAPRSRRFGGQTTAAPTVAAASTTTTTRSTTRRPLRRKGFGHQTTTTTTETIENAEHDVAVLTNNVKLEAENDTIDNENVTEATSEVDEVTENIEEVDNSPKGLRRRKFNFKQQSSAAVKPKTSKLKINNSAANNKQPVSANFLKSKQNPRLKLQPVITTTTASTESTTKRRTFRFKPKVTKHNAAVTEVPSTTEGAEVLANDTLADYESDAAVDDEQTTTVEPTTTVGDRIKPVRGQLFARPGAAGSIKRARTVPSTSRTTTSKPISVTSSAIKKPFSSRFRSTTTSTTTSNGQLIDTTTISAVTTGRTKQKRLFSPRVQTTLATSTVPSIALNPIVSVAEPFPNLASTTLPTRKRRRRPQSTQLVTEIPIATDLPTSTLPTSKSAATTLTAIASTEIWNPILDLHFDQNSSDIGTRQEINPSINENINNTFAIPSANNKRRKLRRRKLSQRSTAAVELPIFESTSPTATSNNVSTETTTLKSTPSDIATSTVLESIKEPTDNFTKEKSKAQAKKELLEKIALKSATQKFQQNGFTFNTDEPLIMEADDSGVWFSNPDESSASDNRSPPLSFIPNGRIRSVVKISEEKQLSPHLSLSSNNDSDSWFSAGSEEPPASGNTDRKDEETNAKVDQVTTDEPTTTTPIKKSENQPKFQTSRTATFSVSSSTSVQSATSKRRSSSSIGSLSRIHQNRPDDKEEPQTTTRRTIADSEKVDDNDDGFQIMELGPPRVIVIDKVTLDDPQREAETTTANAEQEETETVRTTESADIIATTSSSRIRSNGRSLNDRRNSGRDRNRETTTTTTDATTTTSEVTTEPTTTSTATETPRSSSDEVGYFGPEEVVPEAKGALDGPLDDTQYESGGIFEDREQNANDEVASVNVSEHNDDEGHQSEPAPGDEASIWELAALTDYSDHFSQSSSFNVEVRSKAPATIQVPSKRDITRSVVPRVKYENYDDKSDEMFNKLQGLKYDTTAKSFDNYDLMAWSSKTDNLRQTTENLNDNRMSSNKASTIAPRRIGFFDGPNNCSRSDRNVCPISNDDYPRFFVENTVKQHEVVLRELWKTLEADRNPAQIYPEDNEDETSKHDLSVCDSTVETIRPGWARDARDDKWKIIINTPAFPQFIRTELCLRLNKECLFISPYYRSSCTEHHSAHRLVAIDPEKPSSVPVIGIFKFPCGCSCKVEMFHGRK